MTNILGENLLHCFDLYKNRSNINQSFEEYFYAYFSNTILDSDRFYIIIDEFLKKDFLKINKDMTNEEIDVIIYSLQNKLLNEHVIYKDTNIYELLGYILLGNIIK